MSRSARRAHALARERDRRAYFFDFWEVVPNNFPPPALMEQIAPANLEAYNTTQSASINYDVNGLTLDAQRSLPSGRSSMFWRSDDRNGGVGAISYEIPLRHEVLDPASTEGLAPEVRKRFGVDPRGTGGRVQRFPNTMIGVNSGIWVNQSGIVNPGGTLAPRSGNYAIMQPNYTFLLGGTFWETTESNTPFASGPNSEIKVLTKVANPPIADYPEGAKQITSFGWTYEIESGGTQLQTLVAGQEFFIELDGTKFSHTVTVGDVADAPYFDAIINDIGAQIDADPNFNLVATNTLLREAGSAATFVVSIEIERDVINTPFTFDMTGSFGIEFLVENFTQ